MSVDLDPNQAGPWRDRPTSRRRRLCAACRQRRALFQHAGRVRADRQHVLCFQCYRAELDRARARGLAERASAGAFQPSVRPARELTAAQIAHRRRMLAYLEAQRAARPGGAP